MGGTIPPPTQREIESENRQLKTKLENVARVIRRVMSNVSHADSLDRLQKILNDIEPKKRAAMDISESVDYQAFIASWIADRENEPTHWSNNLDSIGINGC